VAITNAILCVPLRAKKMGKKGKRWKKKPFNCGFKC